MLEKPRLSYVSYKTAANKTEAHHILKSPTDIFQIDQEFPPK